MNKGPLRITRNKIRNELLPFLVPVAKNFLLSMFSHCPVKMKAL
jgi:hypothetical protein